MAKLLKTTNSRLALLPWCYYASHVSLSPQNINIISFYHFSSFSLDLRPSPIFRENLSRLPANLSHCRGPVSVTQVSTNISGPGISNHKTTCCSDTMFKREKLTYFEAQTYHEWPQLPEKLKIAICKSMRTLRTA